MSIEKLDLTLRTAGFGCGIYEAGDTEHCYVKLFVTDDGFVLPVNHRVISEEDLMATYQQGRRTRDIDHALRVLAEDLYESGREIGEMISNLRMKAYEERRDG